MNPFIHPYSKELFLIELVPPIRGFDQFIGVWLYKGDITFLVDVGPASTISTLLEALSILSVSHLDYIFLTHIHIDHAGAIGQLSAQFQDVPIVCHGKGLPHLVDPSRLWAGSVTTLGEKALAYGPMTAVSERLLIPVDQFNSKFIRVLMTPGHAPHHVSYMTPDYLFAGEAGGVCIQFQDGRRYLRPATPPQQVLPTTLSSIDLLIGAAPKTICYTHFGLQQNATQWLHRQKEQLLFWEREISEKMKHVPPEEIVDACLTHLFSADPELAAYDAFSTDQREREKFFASNSIKGLVGYLS